MNIVESKTSFHAEIAVIYLIIEPAVHPIDEAILDVQINLATHATIRTRGWYDLIRSKHEFNPLGLPIR
jgi:hypothetical protein